jgi:threonine dehydrogenase-like Zn-dependent dehydrogenase
MKALVYTKEKTLVYQDVEDPKVSEEDVLVKIESVGICGSDMHAYLGHDERRPAPLILGHEAAGFIVEGKKQGRRVTVNPLVSCGNCYHCLHGRNNICSQRQLISMPPREGAFAEFLSIPYKNVLLVPDKVDISHAALTEPLACGWHAVKLGINSLSVNSSTAKCLIIGGGAIGVGVCLSLRAKGIKDITVIEKNPLRRENLKNNLFNGLKILEELNPEVLYDLVIDAVGFSDTRSIASTFCRPGGVIIHIGLGDGLGGLNIRRMTLQEITFIGTYTYTPEDFEETAEAIFNGKMGSFRWVEKRNLIEGNTAFVDILTGTVSASKIILQP